MAPRIARRQAGCSHLTPEEIAALLKVSTQTVTSWAHHREIETIEIGWGPQRRVFRITKKALEEFLARRTVASNVPTPAPGGTTGE